MLGSFLPSPLVVKQPKSTRVEGADIVMKSCKFPILNLTGGRAIFDGVASSGQTVPGHLMNPSSAGLAWLSRGTVGPEGSLLCTLLIVAVWLCCARFMRETKYPGAATA